MVKSIEKILSAIFHTIGVSNKRDQKFWIKLFEVLLHMRGRKNYTNIARYGSFSESTLRRRLSQPFDWLSFNISMLKQTWDKERSPLIGVIDCSFIRKSGNQTYGLDKFWSGVLKQSLKGLEISLLGVVEVLGTRAWALDVQQTPANLSKATSNAGFNRLDFYLSQLNRCLPHVPEVLYWVADSFYAKAKMFDLFQTQGRFLITQLRNDANLQYLTPLENPSRPGPKPKMGEKVIFSDLNRWQLLGRDFKLAHLNLYTQKLYSPQFGLVLRVVLVQNKTTNTYQILASSNPEQDPRQVVAYYQSRFQMEFVFRDAKQFAGLEHAQTRKKENLHNHFNMAMASVNLMNTLQLTLTNMTSKNSLLRVAFNTNLIQQLIRKLGLKPELMNSKYQYEELYFYGAFAA
jgi:hypothetical protein